MCFYSYTIKSIRIFLYSLLYPFHRTYILPAALRLKVKVQHSTGGIVKAVTGICKIKCSHRFLHPMLNTSILLLIIKWPVFKHKILCFRNIKQLHIRRYISGIMNRKTDTITPCPQVSPVTQSAVLIVAIGHDLTASAVDVIPTAIIELTFNAIQ